MARLLEVDERRKPSQTEILEYAEWLGLDLEEDQDLLWIAKAGLAMPVPFPWKPYQLGEDGTLFYFNYETGESVWDHPCDDKYRQLVQNERAKKAGRRPLQLECLRVGATLEVSCTNLAGEELSRITKLDPQQSFCTFVGVIQEHVPPPDSCHWVFVLPKGHSIEPGNRSARPYMHKTLEALFDAPAAQTDSKLGAFIGGA